MLPVPYQIHCCSFLFFLCFQLLFNIHREGCENVTPPYRGRLSKCRSDIGWFRWLGGLGGWVVYLQKYHSLKLLQGVASKLLRDANIFLGNFRFS